jgi:hypothetical protein
VAFWRIPSGRVYHVESAGDEGEDKDEGRAEESEGNGDDQGSDWSGRDNPVIKR